MRVGVCGRARPHARGLHEIVARESFNEGYDFQDVTKEERNVAKDAALFYCGRKKSKITSSIFF